MRKYINRKVFKEITKVSIGYFLTVFGALIGIRILTNFLSPNQYGELSLGITTGTLIYTIFLAPLSSGITRYISIAREKKETSLFLKSSYNLFLKLTIFLALFSLLVIILIYFLGFHKWVNLAIASIGFGFVYSFNNVIVSLQISYRKRGIVSFYQGLITIMRFLFAIILIMIFGASSEAAMFGQLTGLFLVLISQYYFIKSTLNKEISKENQSDLDINWGSKIIQFSIPLMSLGFLNWLRLAFEKWGLVFFANYDDSAVGYYSIIYQYGYYPISLVVSLFISYLRPIYFEKAGDDNKKLKSTYRIGIKIFIFAFLSLFTIVIITFYNRDFIFTIILNKNYLSISYLIGPMMMSALFSESTNFVSLLLQTKNNTKKLFLPNASTYISGIIFSIFGLYYLGLYGLVFASLINSMLTFSIFVYICSSEFKKIDLNLS